jgi:hypothetical protein
MFRFAYAAAISWAAALLALGCGGGESAVAFKKGGPPAPKKCLERWNADGSARAFGQHAYAPGHDSRAGHAFLVNDRERQLVDTCVVVFAASKSDREFGTLGAFSGKAQQEEAEGGFPADSWPYITNYPVESEKERVDLQLTGAEQANVALHRDGKITLLR